MTNLRMKAPYMKCFVSMLVKVTSLYLFATSIVVNRLFMNYKNKLIWLVYFC